ncbi:hypothetical protein L916_10617 [Phytophthora nicotianae]|uniref:Uncharacterized protein n=1 Tax=Phytophthora nicotianae TaxID=4792 RepID=W2IWI1_PHYNI|nr:hypothetical protein L916_10617 [Phytophthora nicotianae]
MHILGYGISCRFPPPLARSIAGAYRAQSVMFLFVVVGKGREIEFGQFGAAAAEGSLGGWSGYRGYQIANIQLRTSLMEGSRPTYSTFRNMSWLEVSERNRENNSMSTLIFRDITAFRMFCIAD